MVAAHGGWIEIEIEGRRLGRVGGGGQSIAALDCGRGVDGGGCQDGQAAGVMIGGGSREEVMVGVT